ncbi:NADH dehydrogenase (ubiquinone) 1 alpha subcomplex subunit 12 [Entomortierella parvispora]|uniref:NADH dehydrogenase [ubiquinone] 1 alpha subcomplex subunit n=1 Tax=Entomortierella parvispora TaxID=205924 RepID=A0A9P3M177_9FUNG|nr:NADH dehydrogenase (ubiquinone) 1 alpha subcomplex subunit 12 [Entomortierella parvispora]
MSSFPRTVKGFFALGPARFFRQLNNIGDTKVGTLVGTDKFGNKYYENLKESYGRTRWIQFAKEDSFFSRAEANASQVPAEWHGWLHRMLDAPPTTDKSMVIPKWAVEYTENLTGSAKAFKTYNTTRPKFVAWTPKAAPRA